MNGPDEIARYSFLPWLRQGVAGGIEKPDDFGAGTAGQGERAEVTYDLFVNTRTVSKDVSLVGPGDVTGLERRAIVRVEPPPLTTDFESNYLPFVDFYDEDLPWRYTPARASGEHRLRPWLALIVLAEDEFEDGSPPGAPLPAIAVASPATLLPPPEELWAWSHVHVNEDLSTAADPVARLDGILAATPDLAGSRLLAPRRLRPNTAYHAFLVPTFETGRHAGLGQEIPAGSDGLAAAWGADPVVLPTYFSWRFRTGEEGDFEHLVRLLEARVLDPRVGIRDMDVQGPGFGLPSAGQPVLGLEGALRTPATTSTPWTDPAAFQARLTELVNLADDQQEPGGGDDPTVSLPLYGRWHALTRRLGEPATPRWVADLNLDPRPRAAAGLGSRVVRAFQEQYMDEAWEQVGEVLAANRLIHRASLSAFASQALYRQHLEPQPVSALVSITQPVHSKVLASPTTLAFEMGRSRLPLAVVDPAFRKILRPGGRIRTKLAPDAARRPDAILERVNAGAITAAPPKRPGSGQTAVDRHLEELKPTGPLAALRRLLGRPRWLLPALLILLLLLAILLLATGLGALATLAGAAAAAVVGLWNRVRRQLEAEDAVALLDETRLTPEAAAGLPPRPGFTVSDAGGAVPEIGRGGVDSPQGARLRRALADLYGRFTAAVPQPAPRPPLTLARARQRLLEELEPGFAVRQRLAPRLGLAPRAGGEPLPFLEEIVPIMAAPDFPHPMYKELEKISAELLIPNLGLIPRNTISLLTANQPFIEAYMAGLNHEMARELLWREYPTDQRGSYFRQFWDVADVEAPAAGLSEEEVEERLRDIPPIHTWRRPSRLGEHNHRLPPGDSKPRLVLVIRGDLLRRYPTAVISAAPARWPDGAGPSSDREVDFDGEITPLFTARVGEDVTFFGFDLTAAEARGTRNPADGRPGWFFLIRERPGEPRFGLDFATAAAAETIDEWNDLSWGHLGDPEDFDTLENVKLVDGLHHVNVTPANNPDGVQWGTHSGELAHILYQVPVVVAVHAHRMLEEVEE